MTVRSVGDNVNQLEKLYRIVTPENLSGRYKLEKLGAGKLSPTVVGEILDVFINTTDASGASGLLTYDEIDEKFLALQLKSNNPDELEKYIKFYPDTPTNIVLGGEASKLSKVESTQLHVIGLTTPMLGMSLRDVNLVGTFLNAIPSIEISRCVPRLEVQFETGFANTAGDSAADLSSRAPTLLRFLNGSSKSYGTADKLMANASVQRTSPTQDPQLSTVNMARSNKDPNLASVNMIREAKAEETARVVSGMELFTTPQTMTSLDNTLDGHRVPIIDKFAGFMSLESLELTAVPAGGTFANKTARLNLVLHDRSRLHEVASLIRPDAYSQTTVSLTYGWSHPDTTGENPIADLINQMVVKNEKYNIYNSTFSFGQGGGVRIVLHLSMKGTNELRVVRIADSEKLFNLNVQLDNLSRAIRDARSEFTGLTKPDNVREDVKLYQVIDAAADNGELLENYTDKDGVELRNYITKLIKSPANKGDPAKLEKLNKVLSDMLSFITLGKERAGMFKVDAKNTNKTPRIDEVLGKRYQALLGQQPDGSWSAAVDPYFQIDAPYWQKGFLASEKKGIEEEINGKAKRARKWVSLAKLLLYYVGIPLQAVGTINEVQFVYYPLNSEAGYAAGTSLASFPIEMQYFHDVLADFAKKNRNANMTVAQFVELLNSTVIQDVRHPAYGMREAYNARDPNKLDEPAKAIGDPATASSNLAGKFGGVFRKPRVEIQIECRGGRPLKQGESESNKSGQRIVRIHIYDKLSTAYEPTLQVLEAQQGLETLKTDKSTVVFNQLKDVADQIGLNLKDQKFANYEQLKSFISQVTPVLNYGANSSGIIAATVASMQNSDLATVNMQRAMGQPYNSDPSTQAASAIPFRVQPSQLDLTLFGCPLLNLAQQFFVDFSTGTTIDDLYTLTHLSHTISAGKFESTAKLTPMNAYGAYENVASKVAKMKDTIDELLKKTDPSKTWG